MRLSDLMRPVFDSTEASAKASVWPSYGLSRQSETPGADWVAAVQTAAWPPGYETARGAVCEWARGGECSIPRCDVDTHELGRGYHSTALSINSTIPLTISSENESPFGSFHSGGAHFVFADGHVSFINESINMNTYQALSTIAGGKIISGSEY